MLSFLKTRQATAHDQLGNWTLVGVCGKSARGLAQSKTLARMAATPWAQSVLDCVRPSAALPRHLARGVRGGHAPLTHHAPLFPRQFPAAPCGCGLFLQRPA